MARRKYPSDHRPYFRVLEDILTDEKLNALPPVDQLVFFRILATLCRQNSKDGRCFLPIRDARVVFLTHSDRGLDARMVRIGSGLGLDLVRTVSGVALTVPKWSEIQGFTTPLRVEENRVEEIREEKSRRKRPKPAAEAREEDPVALSFATDFRSAVERTQPGWKPPTPTAFSGWVRESRLLIAERGEAAVRDLARWLFDTTSGSKDASFWRGNALCVAKFRQKFDQMAARRRTEAEHGANRVRANGHSTSDLAERARAYVRAARAAESA